MLPCWYEEQGRCENNLTRQAATKTAILGECRNFIDKSGLICNIYSGDISTSVLKKAEEELTNLAAKLRKAGKRVLVLTDISNIGNMPTRVRQKGVEVIRNLEYDKAAIFGDEGFAMQVAKLIIKVSMMDYKIKIFNNEEDARNWLLGGEIIAK